MPDLIVIAGCNGSGKSTFASSFLPEGISSFDFDRLYTDYYNSLPDSELRDHFARNYASEMFEKQAQNALSKGYSFCYETNFDTSPLLWPETFKAHGYRLNLIFFCLANQDIARHRVRVRTECGGHFVDNETIDLK